MESIIISTLYKVAKQLVSSDFLKYLEQEIIRVGLQQLEGYKKKMIVVDNATSEIKKDTNDFKQIKSYILSMIVDICVAYLKTKRVLI